MYDIESLDFNYALTWPMKPFSIVVGKALNLT